MKISTATTERDVDSKSFKVSEFVTNRKSIRDFLLVVNLGRILHGFGGTPTGQKVVSGTYPCLI